MINEVFDDSSVTEIEKVFNRVHEQPIYTQKKVFKFEGVGWDYDQIVDSHKAICNPDGDVIAVVGKLSLLTHHIDRCHFDRPPVELLRAGLALNTVRRSQNTCSMFVMFGVRDLQCSAFGKHMFVVGNGLALFVRQFCMQAAIHCLFCWMFCSGHVMHQLSSVFAQILAITLLFPFVHKTPNNHNKI